MPLTTEQFQPQPSPARRRVRRIFIAAVLVLALLIIGGVVAVMSTGHDDHHADTSTGPAPDGSGGAGVGDAAITWNQVGATQLPFSPTAGPRTQVGVSASGFAHTPAGALIAAIQIPFRIYVLAGTDDILANQVLGDDGDRAQVRADAATLQAGLNTGQILPRPYAWRAYGPYNDGDATFDIATARADGTYNLLRFAVVWIGGDWKYQPGLGGNAPDAPVTADALSEQAGWHHFTERSLQ